MSGKLTTYIAVSTLALTVLMSGCSSGEGEDDSSNWSLFRGDAGLSGYTKTNIPAKPVLLWSYMGDSRTSSSPVVFDNTVYWRDRKSVV